MLDDEPRYPFGMIRTAFNVAGGSKTDISTKYSRVRLPDITFDIKPDISFVEGARVKFSTGVTMRVTLSSADSFPPPDLVFDRPFIGWFTQPGASNLPIAIFYAYYDCWEKVESLEL